MRAASDMVGGEVFVPKIPSMNIMDLAAAMGPDCKVKHIGIRPGEKLHEVLISEDESRTTVEMDDVYVVLPAHPWWSNERWSSGKTLPEGFTYASNNNPQWLTVDELREWVAGIKNDGTPDAPAPEASGAPASEASGGD